MNNLRHLRIVLGIFCYFGDFYLPNRLIMKIMDYGNLKNRQTANMAVFRRFLCGFCTVFVGFSLFWWFLSAKLANLANYGLWISEKPPIWRFLAVFRRFLCSFFGFLAIFHYFDNFHQPKWLIWQIMGLEIWKTFKLSI